MSSIASEMFSIFLYYYYYCCCSDDNDDDDAKGNDTNSSSSDYLGIINIANLFDSEGVSFS